MHAKNLNLNSYIYVLYYKYITYILTHKPSFYPYKIIYFICNGGVGTASQRYLCIQWHGDMLMTSHKQRQIKKSIKLADIDVRLPIGICQSQDCSMFCNEKCKRLKWWVSSKNVCLFWFFTSQSTFYQSCWDRSSWVETVLSRGYNGHVNILSLFIKIERETFPFREGYHLSERHF